MWPQVAIGTCPDGKDFSGNWPPQLFFVAAVLAAGKSNSWVNGMTKKTFSDAHRSLVIVKMGAAEDQVF